MALLCCCGEAITDPRPAADLVEGLGITGKNPFVYALKSLKQLERKGFLCSIQSKAGELTGGRPSFEFWPKAAGEVSSASRTPARNLPKLAEETEETPTGLERRDESQCGSSGAIEVFSVSSVSSGHFEELGGQDETPEETRRNLPPVSNGHNSAPSPPWHEIALSVHAAHPDWLPCQIATHLGPGFAHIDGRAVKAFLEARP